MSNSSLVVELLDDDGDVRTRIDFGALSLNQNVARYLRDAFINEFSHNSLETKRQNWRALRKLSLCISGQGWADGEFLPVDTLVRLNGWLASQNLKETTRRPLYNVCKIALQWCERNTDLFRGQALKLPRLRTVQQQKELTKPLAEDVVKTVLKHCYQEIDLIQSRISAGHRLLQGGWANKEEERVGQLLKELLQIGNGVIPNQKVVNRSGNSLSRRVNEAGGHAALSRQLFPGPEDIFPFYLAILIQTAGNPFSIRQLERNCVRPHPINEDRKSIVWVKRRSHAEQKADFNVARVRAAPSLVMQLNMLTEPLLAHMAAKEKNLLFVAKGKPGTSVPCMQLLHVMLDAFIEKHGLPDFDFKQFRKTSAVFHSEQSGDLLVAKKKLNHRSAKTTASYVETLDSVEKGNELIARYQGQLYELCQEKQPKKSTARNRAESNTQFSTVFGFDCRDPYAGIAPNSSKGAMCKNFYHCATCPGAIVVIDDLAIVARLLKSLEALKRHESRWTVAGWAARFDAAYRPTMEIIERDLLSKVSPTVLEAAKNIVVPNIPFLE
ncbi:MAG: hypothetical protein KGL40_05600 [Rhodocyclaceae bacterium]|nr:hypothetical protein [Rhodocyclaceae bacterium]